MRRMAIPDFQTIMLPLLSMCADGEEHSLSEARETLADRFRLSPEERAQLLPSGRQRVFANRVAWAKIYLQKARLLSFPARGRFCITTRGADVLQAAPERIDIRFLRRFPEFVEFRRRHESPSDAEPELAPEDATETPEEELEAAHQRIRSELAEDLLARVKAGTPAAFERLVVELLLRMGYGGSRKEAGEAIGGAGDEGIDGTISEDRLGLDTIYVQAKKWSGSVGRPEIQKFVGALHGKRARKGVFLTTGTFSAEAHDYVSHIDPRVVLIDGEHLAEHMIDLNLGVTTVATYEVKRIDSDYFGDE